MQESSPDAADLSPALGGARAIPDAPPPPPEADAPAGAPWPPASGAWPGPEGEALRAELETLLGDEGAEVIEALGQLGTLGMGLSSLFTGALQALETHLPDTLAAFEGLVDAVGQAVDDVLDPRVAPDEDTRS
jgi:hypothetical protein